MDGSEETESVHAAVVDAWDLLDAVNIVEIAGRSDVRPSLPSLLILSLSLSHSCL